MRRRFHSVTLGATAVAWIVAVGAQAADWPDQRRDGRFVVRADFSLAGLEPRFAELARLEQELSAALSLSRTTSSLRLEAPQQATIDVYLFGGEAAYRRHLAKVLPTPPDRRALYVQLASQGRVYAFRSKDMATDLRHECTHALLHASAPKIPLWLDEGLAEYFEAPAEQRFAGNPHLTEMRRFANRNKQAPSLARLEQFVMPEQLTVDDYRDAWAWTHFLLHGSSTGRRELSAYLEELGTNESPHFLHARLERLWPDLDARFLQHFRGSRL